MFQNPLLVQGSEFGAEQLPDQEMHTYLDILAHFAFLFQTLVLEWPRMPEMNCNSYF